MERKSIRFISATETATIYCGNVVAVGCPKRETIATEDLNVPLLKALEVTAAVRYDKCSDVGNTTNPKFSFRYQPITPVLIRGEFHRLPRTISPSCTRRRLTGRERL